MRALIMRGGVMDCPKCNKPMWDNRNKKKTPKAPDFRCKDENCKYSLNPDTGEYEPGEYQTAIWLKDLIEPEPIKTKTPPPKTNDTYVEGKKENTTLMCRKDLMVAIVNKWQDVVDTIVMIDTFNKVIDEKQETIR